MTPRSERHGYVRPADGLGWKRDFQELEANGLFGRPFRRWGSIKAMRRDWYRGWVRIGSREASSPFKVNEVHTKEVSVVAFGLLLHGASAESMYFEEVPAPSNERLINFEVYRNEKYLHLEYGFGQMPLRTDLNRNLFTPATGLKALTILRSRLGPDYDVLEEIWDRWPSSAIEGSRWRRPVGPDRRRLRIWEAREY